MELKYIIKKSNKYETIKQILKEEFLLSERLILKLKKANQIYINNSPVNIYYKYKINDILTVNLDFNEDNDNILPNQLPLNILYEDECFLILNKPARIPVHPSMEHYTDSLSNGVKYYFDSIGLKRKIRPINRLDKDTSGIVIFAKNQYVQECLIKQMKLNQFEKKYVVLVDGIIKFNNLTINEPISRKDGSIIERCVNPNRSRSYNRCKIIKHL